MKVSVSTILLACGSLILVAACLSAGVGAVHEGSSPRLLHTEPSDDAPVVVFEQYGARCMNFEEIEGEGRQTCFELDDPDNMVFEYTRMMTSALFAKPDPDSILVIGLGGATLPIALHQLLPNAVIDTVELDPAVVRVAEKFFGYETGPRQRVFIEDSRAFVEKALRSDHRYDMVILDAFDTEYLPKQLLTVEFLQQVHSLLTPDGLVVANSFTQSRMYERESATYAAVFGPFYNLRASVEGNRVIVASRGTLPDKRTLKGNALALAAKLERFG